MLYFLRLIPTTLLCVSFSSTATDIYFAEVFHQIANTENTRARSELGYHKPHVVPYIVVFKSMNFFLENLVVLQYLQVFISTYLLLHSHA